MELESVLQLASRSADCLSMYGTGASGEVRAALQKCDDAAVQNSSFAIVRQFVRRIRKYFETAQRIEKVGWFIFLVHILFWVSPFSL